jgi:glyoxylase-like metal-dependent hydrolase (beta-lactamase superfamily II)
MPFHPRLPGLWQVTRLVSFNCQLIAYKDGLTLVDTGLAGTAPAIAKAIREIGLPLRRILITHAHTDHVGSLDALAALFPSAEVAASARSARLMAGMRTLEPTDEGRPLKGGFKRTRTVPHRIVAEGDRIEGLRVIGAAGHAPDHVAYLFEPTGVLLAGDALHSAGGRLTVSGEFRPRFPFPFFSTWDKHLALATARRLADLRPAALAVGHGPVLLDPQSALENAIRHAERAFAKHPAPTGSSQTA